MVYISITDFFLVVVFDLCCIGFFLFQVNTQRGLHVAVGVLKTSLL